MDNPYENSMLADTGTRRKGCSPLFIFALVLVAGGLAVLLLVPAFRRGSGVKRFQCKNNLKQIVLGLHDYHDQYGSLPPAYTVGEDGTRLHSWRTLILPFIDQENLYEQIDLTKPWNDPVNREASEHGVACFQCPASNTESNRTNYVGVVGNSFGFHPTQGRRFDEITDGTSHSILIVEVPERYAVEWMRPDDAIGVKLLRSLQNESELTHTGGVQSAFADGTVPFIQSGLERKTIEAMLTIDADDNDNIEDW